jgi:hypothetical protein
MVDMGKVAEKKQSAGSVAISQGTTLQIRRVHQLFEQDPKIWSEAPAASVAMQLVSLDAFLQALFCHEQIIAFGHPQPGGDAFVVQGCPELPADLVVPGEARPSWFPHGGLVRELAASPAYVGMVSHYESAGYELTRPRASDPYWGELVRHYAPAYQPASPLEQIPEEFVVQARLMLRADATAADVGAAMDRRVPFFASQIETPICIYEQLEGLRKLNPKLPSKWALEQLKRAWYTHVSAAEELKGEGFFSAEIPYFLLAVFRGCDAPIDLFRVAMQMRDEREARNFRSWVKKLAAEDDPVALLRQTKTIDALAQRLINRLTEGPLEKWLKYISFGFFPPGVSAGMNAAEPVQYWRTRRHVRFLSTIFQPAGAGMQLQQELQRLFALNDAKAHEVVMLLDSLPGQRQPPGQAAPGAALADAGGAALARARVRDAATKLRNQHGKAVVKVRCAGGTVSGFMITPQGQGVTVDYFAAHAGPDEDAPATVDTTFGGSMQARMIRVDPTLGIAVFELDVDKGVRCPYLEFSKARAAVGESVVGLGYRRATTLASVEGAIADADERRVYMELDQADEDTSGFGGGPLLNQIGEVVGVWYGKSKSPWERECIPVDRIPRL